MNSGNLKVRVVGAFLGLALISSVGAGFASPIRADGKYSTAGYTQDRRDRDQDRDRDRDGDHGGRRHGRSFDGYPDLGGSPQLRQTALNAGYNEGIKVGRKDRNHRGRDFRDQSSYRNANKDYNSRLGDREIYRRYFRMAYETGYNDGLNGN